MKQLEDMNQAELIARIKALEQEASQFERSKQQLKEAENRLYKNSILLESSVEGPQNMAILSLDTEYRYLYFNHTHAVSMRNTYAADIKLGDCIFDHISQEEDAAEVKKYYDTALAGTGHISVRESGAGDAHAYFETFYNPIYDKHSSVVGVAVFAQNITARKLAEKRAKESDALRELLLDIITHDLKNPAGVIFGMAQLLQEEDLESDLIDPIYRSSERLLHVLNDTTILSQAIFGESIPKEDLNLKALLQEVCDDFKSRLDLNKMELEISVDPDITIHANHLIGEVFKNYISNAMKYASAGKRIEIFSSRTDTSTDVCIRDYGDTIQRSDQKRIFDRQVQIEDGQEKGRGLGLAIVKRIAQAHDGSCWVEAAPDQGNLFWLSLPHETRKQ